MTTQNQALVDELEAVSSIYDDTTCSIAKIDPTTSETTAILKLPDLPFSFLVKFPPDYPDAPPEVINTQSTGAYTKIGQGEAAAGLLRDVLGRIFVPGQVCLFDLIEETVPLLKQEIAKTEALDREVTLKPYDGTYGNQPEDFATTSAAISTQSIAPQLQSPHPKDLTSSIHAVPADLAAFSLLAEPLWILSEPHVENKSTFVARALAVSNLKEATNSIGHLLATNRRVASATHNITAWRIKQKHLEAPTTSAQIGKQDSTPEIVIQDCDDDGETAAGGRLLHLMQLMDVWNVVVVVTRWYGGVKLGPDRFRCINSVAREALVNGGFSKEDHESKSKGGKGKGKKK